MDYIYLVDLSAYIRDEEIKSNDVCSCSLSSRNVLAFSCDCNVYMLPLEKPNELIPINLSGNSPCTNLCWSNDCLFLLNVHKNGICNLYNIKVSTFERAKSGRLRRSRLLNLNRYLRVYLSISLSISFERLIY
jgi:hypothetical protein